MSDPTDDPDREKTILVVEDDSLVRMSVSHFLQRAGYRVIQADSVAGGRAALAQHAEHIDLALLDVVLPGPEPAAALREDLAALTDVPLVFMSAHPRETLLESGQLPSGAESLHKPFGSADLLALVARVLGTR